MQDMGKVVLGLGLLLVLIGAALTKRFAEAVPQAIREGKLGYQVMIAHRNA